MATTPKLIKVETNMNGRLQAHRDIDYTNGTWQTGPPEVIGQKVDVYGAGGMGIAMFTFDTPAAGKVVSLSVDDPEGVCHFFQKSVTVAKNQIQVAAVFMIPSCRSEHTITIKGKSGGVEVSAPVVVFP